MQVMLPQRFTNTIDLCRQLHQQVMHIDFGDLPDTDTSASYGVASRVRGIVAGGNMVNRIQCYIQYVTTLALQVMHKILEI